MASVDHAGAQDGEPAVVVELDAEDAAKIFAVSRMLRAPDLAPAADADAPTLEALLAASGAPLRLENSVACGRRLVATRDIVAGEVLLEESALAFTLCRSPGHDGVYSMSDPTGRLLATLPPWPVLRTFRDSLTLSPEYAFRAEAAWGILWQLSALGGSAPHAGFADMPAIAPGAITSRAAVANGEEEDDDEDEGGVPAATATPLEEVEVDADADSILPRAHLLQAIAQCNAFSASLPSEDSAWKRALLWPLLGRLRVASDRERLFDDAAPFSTVSALFPLGALFNHACGASANVSYEACAWEEGDPSPRVRFVALRNLREGEEATHSYLSGIDSTPARRKKLLTTYRFLCACATCIADESALAPGSGLIDPLAHHLPLGRGAEGTCAFFRAGGRYPDTPDEQLPEEE